MSTSISDSDRFEKCLKGFKMMCVLKNWYLFYTFFSYNSLVSVGTIQKPRPKLEGNRNTYFSNICFTHKSVLFSERLRS